MAFDVADTVVYPGRVVHHRSGAHFAEKTPESGFPFSAPVVHRKQGTGAQQVGIGFLADVGGKGGSVKGWVVHLHLVLPEQIFPVLQRPRGAAGGSHQRAQAEKYEFPRIHPYKCNTFFAFLSVCT